MKLRRRRSENGVNDVSLAPQPAGVGQEGYGEDSYLQAEIGTQYVQGLQFGPDPKYIEAIVS